MLLFCSVLMAWAQRGSLAVNFDLAREILVACFSKRLRPGATYTGFIEASLRHGSQLLALVAEHLCKLVYDIASAGECWETGGWILMGVDGTRIATPRTTSNLKKLGGLGHDASNPQVWMTTILHLATGLPWMFTVDRGDSSERHHLRQMLGCLPQKSLLIADAGYVGFDLWQMMMRLDQAFLIRVGSNIRLIKRLSRCAKMRVSPNEELVWLWPENKSSSKPLMLRLLVVDDGKSRMYLLTNVLEQSRLSAEQMREFYARRWQMELWFRCMKQTMEKHKLRSRAGEQAMLEASWAAVGLTLLGLMHVEALIKAGGDPSMASCAGALKVVRLAMRTERPRRRADALSKSLAAMLKDDYTRLGPKQTSRYPRKKRYRHCGPPILQPATAKQIQQYQELQFITRKRNFTA
jgi:hypothetical protein